jgi:hypothetical protein
LGSVLDQLDEDGIAIVRDGKTVAHLYPSTASEAPGPCSHLIGALQGRLKIKGDVMSTGIKWDAES